MCVPDSDDQSLYMNGTCEYLQKTQFIQDLLLNRFRQRKLQWVSLYIST